MVAWAQKHSECVNCGTNRHSHHAKGYCDRCYRLIRKLKQVENWDLDNTETLKGYPRESIFHAEREFKLLKRGHIAQIKERLDYLKRREELLSGPIDGLKLEYEFRSLARLAGARNRNLFFGIAGYLGDSFTQGQLKILFELFNKIFESIPWAGIDYGHIYNTNTRM